MPEWRHIEYAESPAEQVVCVTQTHGIAGDKYDAILQDTVYTLTPSSFQVNRGQPYGPRGGRDGNEVPRPGTWSTEGNFATEFARLTELVKAVPDERGKAGLASEVYPSDSPRGQVFAILDQIFQAHWPNERIL